LHRRTFLLIAIVWFFACGYALASLVAPHAARPAMLAMSAGFTAFELVVAAWFLRPGGGPITHAGD
jgi:peptidoglycan/LPS O-acetylase OafA/YrhL